MTVAASVAISGLVALTLSPALCARVLRRGAARDGCARGARAGVRRSHRRLREPAAARDGASRVHASRVGVAWFALGLVMLWAGAVDREFIPPADRGGFFVITRAPEGATIEYTDRYQHQVEAHRAPGAGGRAQRSR